MNAPLSRTRGIVLAAAIIALPSFLGGGGLISIVSPLPVFLLLVYRGRKEGLEIIAQAILVAGAISFILGSSAAFFFTLSFIPLGIGLARGAEQMAIPWRAGLKGTFALLGGWLVFWTFYGMVFHFNPYAALLGDIDRGIETAMEAYVEDARLSGEAMETFQETALWIKDILPKISPGLIVASAVLAVWTNMTLGHAIMRKKSSEHAPWPEYKEWRLPDTLVWGVALSVAMLLPDDHIFRLLGANFIIILGVLYFFQGLAVLMGLFSRWEAPKPLRALIYAILFLQVYGTMLLSLLGIADVWADFMKLRKHLSIENQN